MIFDKSKDYLKQSVTRTILYAIKVAEGDPVFNTSSVAEFATIAKEVQYCVKQSIPRKSPKFLQNEECTIYIWREPWLQNFTVDRLPCLSDKLFADDNFWLVNSVTFTDMDNSGEYQRFALHCTGSNKTLVS